MADILPSKRFLIRGGIAICIVAAILVAQTDWFRGLFHKEPLPTLADARVGDIIGRDTNGNGIADWEEQLWGLDPAVLYTNGTPNAEIIAQKKQSLGINDAATGSINDTDEVARRLFVLSSALGQAEGVDSGTLQNVAQNLGETIAVERITNHYSSKDLTRVGTTNRSLAAYYTAMRGVFTEVTTESDEVTILTRSLEAGDLSGLAQLDRAAGIYRSFAERVRRVPVPIGIAGHHLAIMNSLYGIGDSFALIGTLDTDGITGLAGLSAYKTFNDALEEAQFGIQQYLIQYGILSS